MKAFLYKCSININMLQEISRDVKIFRTLYTNPKKARIIILFCMLKRPEYVFSHESLVAITGIDIKTIKKSLTYYSAHGIVYVEDQGVSIDITQYAKAKEIFFIEIFRYFFRPDANIERQYAVIRNFSIFGDILIYQPVIAK